MGVVWLAEDTRLNRKVALKTVKSADADTTEGRQRLMREARAAAALNHPHIAAVHDVLDVDGKVVVVFEYVEGETLSARLQRGPMPVAGDRRSRVAARRCAGRRARAGHHPSRPQAVERGARSRVARQGARLRHRAHGAGGRRHVGERARHDRRRPGRHAGLCGAGAIPVAQRRWPRRSLRAGRDDLRDDRRPAAVSEQRRDRAGDVGAAR